ncbi:MAG TPA: EAL domain-containing response regulator [Pseudolabrys sp.]|nr:EAL domain-containing response regulator [Pseudolabrys sp.]
MSAAPAKSSRQSSPAAAVEAPPLAPTAAALCYIVDEDATMRQFLSLVLHGVGIDSVGFADSRALRQTASDPSPDLILLNISLDSADAFEAMAELGARGFRGALQLTSSRGAAVLEHAKNVGIRHKIKMMPVLKKPYDAEAIVKITRELKLGISDAAVSIDLGEALANNWIEFWYQPKVDLRRKKLAGAEAYARARHPQHGILLPRAFMPDAAEDDIAKLSERALESALKTGAIFSKVGVHIPLTVNMQLATLSKLPIEDIVATHRPSAEGWAGLIVDVPEAQIVSDLALAVSLSQRLQPHGVHLAVDESGANHAALAQLDEIPFVELKLDRKFITDCGTDKVNMPLCKAVIDLAHFHRRNAVAMGIEKASDALALVSMGCDFGQGFLLGQPMAEERFVSLLRQRSGTPETAPAS